MKYTYQFWELSTNYREMKNFLSSDAAINLFLRTKYHQAKVQNTYAQTMNPHPNLDSFNLSNTSRSSSMNPNSNSKPKSNRCQSLKTLFHTIPFKGRCEDKGINIDATSNLWWKLIYPQDWLVQCYHKISFAMPADILSFSLTVHPSPFQDPYLYPTHPKPTLHQIFHLSPGFALSKDWTIDPRSWRAEAL